MSSNRSTALYGLLMQATAGDCLATKAPPSSSASQSDEGLKWMAWKKKQGMSKEQAMQAYIDQMDLIDEELTTGGAALMDATGGNAALYRSNEGLYSSQDSISKTGVLYKQRDVFKGWRARTFVLKDKLLTYYLHDDDPVPRSTLILEGCRVQPLKDGHTYTVKKEGSGESLPLFPFSITHPDSNQAYHLAATSQEETDEWIRTLKMAAAGPRRVSLRRKPSVDSRLWQQQQQQRSQHSSSENLAASGDGGGGGGGGSSSTSRPSSSFGLPLPEAGGFVAPGNAALMPPELRSKVSRALQAVLDNTEGGDGVGWELTSTRSDVQVYRRPGLVNSFRGEGRIPAHPVSVLLAVMDLSQRQAYDTHFEFGRRVKMYNGHTSLDYHHYRAVWPTSARDMYNLVHWQVLDNGTIVVVAFSDEDRHPDEAGCVRAECLLAGWVIRPVPPLSHAERGGEIKSGEAEVTLESQVSFVLQTDLKGNLPHQVQNKVSESQPLIIAALRKFLAEHQQRSQSRLRGKNAAGGGGGGGGAGGSSGGGKAPTDLYACTLPLYSNYQVEQAMDNLNRRLLAMDATATSGGGSSQARSSSSASPTSMLARTMSGGAGSLSGSGSGLPAARKAMHQRSLTMREIMSNLAPHIDAQVEDAVFAALEKEASFPFVGGKRRRGGKPVEGGENGNVQGKAADGWELLEERELDGSEGTGSSSGSGSSLKDRSYLNEKDATDVSVLNVCSEGVIGHPPAAVLKALTTLDLVNIWSSAAEFSTHDVLYNVHTWVTYQRLKAMFPMPTRDVCQLVHWRVVENGKRIVVVAVDDSTHPEEEGYIRAHQTEQWVLDAVQDGRATRVFCMFSLDIKGIMTKAVRKELTDKQASVIPSVRKFLDEYMRAGGAGRGGGKDLEGVEGVIPQLNAVDISNEALQPLVLAWNRWSPTMIPDRMHISPTVEELKVAAAAREGRPTTVYRDLLGTEGEGSGEGTDTVAPLGMVGGKSAAAVLKTVLARSVSAPVVPPAEQKRASLAMPRYTLAPSPLPVMPQQYSIHNSGSSTSVRSGTSSPQPHHRPPRHRAGAGSKLRQSRAEGEGGGDDEADDEADEEEEEEEEMRGVVPSVPPSPVASLRSLAAAPQTPDHTWAGAGIHHTPSRPPSSRLGNDSPSIIFRGPTPSTLAAASVERPSPARLATRKAGGAAMGSSSAWSLTGRFAVLLLPVVVYYLAAAPELTGGSLEAALFGSSSSSSSSSSMQAYRGLAFALSLLVAVRYFVSAQARGSRANGDGAASVTEWGQDSIKHRVQVRFPVEIRKLKRYIETKQREAGGLNITVLHVTMRALGMALQQIPELNGHRVLGCFVPSPTADVSCELRLRDGTFALLKVGEVDRKSVADISRMLALKSQALSQGRDVYYNRRKLLVRWCPNFLFPTLDALFAFLGAGLGLSLPWLGIRSFPQGGCIVLTSPAVTSSKGSSCESDFVVEPEPSPSAAFLTPLVLTIGAITSVPKAAHGHPPPPQHQQGGDVVLVPVLNLSLMVQLHQGGASLQHVRRLTELVHKYMADPRLLDALDAASLGSATGGGGGSSAR